MNLATIHTPIQLEQSQIAAVDETMQALSEFVPCTRQPEAAFGALLLADPNVCRSFSRAAVANLPPPLFRATVGRRRGFLSQGDADAYAAGWSAFNARAEPPETLCTPFSQGWFDAESAELDRMDRSWQR